MGMDWGLKGVWAGGQEGVWARALSHQRLGSGVGLA